MKTKKTKYLILCSGYIYLMLSAFGVSAQFDIASKTGGDDYEWKNQRWFAGGGVALTSFGAQEMETYIGAYMNAGYRISPHSYLVLEVAPVFRNPNDLVLEYAYTETVTTSDGHSTSTRHYDGKLTMNYSFTTFLAGWSYEVAFKNKKFLYITPLAGFSTYTPSLKWDPEVDDKPDIELEDMSMTAIGASLMYRYKMVEFGYRVLLHGSGTLYEVEWNNPVSHQFRVGVRFGFGPKQKYMQKNVQRID
jgi:hypothetical protein